MELDQKTIILNSSLKYFRQHGIRKMSMENLAGRLNISTKTFYKYFADKEDLLEQVLQLFFSENFKALEEWDADQNAVALLFEVWFTAIELEFDVNNKFYHDLHYYYPDLEKKIEKRNSDKFWKKLTEIVIRGIEEGYLIKDVIPEAVLEGMTVLYLSITRSDKFKRFGAAPFEIMLNTIQPYIKGVCTTKGIQKLSEHIATYSTRERAKEKTTAKTLC